jgi:hypothetical protein
LRSCIKYGEVQLADDADRQSRVGVPIEQAPSQNVSIYRIATVSKHMVPATSCFVERWGSNSGEEETPVPSAAAAPSMVVGRIPTMRQ